MSPADQEGLERRYLDATELPSMKLLSRRGFMTAPAIGELPMHYYFDVQPYLSELLDRATESPIREVIVYKGQSVGMTTGVLDNVIGYVIDEGLWLNQAEVQRSPNVAERAYATWNSMEWVNDADPLEDLRTLVDIVSGRRQVGSDA